MNLNKDIIDMEVWGQNIALEKQFHVVNETKYYAFLVIFIAL